MKICILHRYPEAEIKATNASFPYLVKELKERGENVEIKTFTKFNRMRWKMFKSLVWIFYAPCLVFNCKYDVIYCDDSFPYYALLVKWASPKSRVIKRMGDLHLMYYVTGWVYKFFHWFERWEWRVCDMLLPITEAMWKYIVQDLRSSQQIKVVNDPIDLADFPYFPETGREHIDVMFHGYLNKNKGVETILEAARTMPFTKFGIVGDGPHLAFLKSIAPDNVLFYGWVSYSEIYRYLADTRVGVAIRSRNPGNDYVITQPVLQYSAVGRPVCVSDRKCFTGQCTFHNVDELVEQIEVLLKDSALRLKLGRISRKVVELNYDARRIGHELTTLLGETKCLTTKT